METFIYTLLGISLFVIYVVYANKKSKDLLEIGFIALEHYKKTKNEKYKLMLITLVSVYQLNIEKSFWAYFDYTFNLPFSEKEKLKEEILSSGTTVRDSINHKKSLYNIDPELNSIVAKSNLIKFKEYVEN